MATSNDTNPSDMSRVIELLNFSITCLSFDMTELYRMFQTLPDIAYARPFGVTLLNNLYTNVETSNPDLAKELTNLMAALNVKHLHVTFDQQVCANWVNFVLPKTIKSIHFEINMQLVTQLRTNESCYV